MMQKIIFILAVLIPSLSFSQSVKIQESSEKVEDIVRQGMFMLLELDKEQVEKAWGKYLKSYGKTSSKSGVISLASAEMKAISAYPCQVYSMVEVSHVGSRVWWAIDLGSKWVTKESEAEYNGAVKMLHEFAVNAYRDDINEQIIDAEKAVSSATKIQEKEVNEGISLTNKITKNREDKVELERKIAENKDDYNRLHIAIDNNLNEQKVAIKNVEAVKASLKHLETEPQSKKDAKRLSKAMNEQKNKVSEGEKLAKEIEKNKRDKVSLESDLVKNGADYNDYIKRQEQNKTDQAAAALDVEKMKKALEIVQEKMSRIE